MKADDGYLKFRGKCRQLSEAAFISDPTLTLVRGHYWCPIWNTDEPHWWCVRADGTIYDPSREQFPSQGSGEYTPFSGIIPCAECGSDARIDGNYAFCSYRCHVIFVGLI